MRKMLIIDSDDIYGLSEALRNALNKRGVNFGEFDYPDEEEPDIDPYIGIMPGKIRHIDTSVGGCGGGCGHSSYGGCGHSSYGDCGYSRC